MKKVTQFLIVCFCAILHRANADFEWSFDESDASVNEALSSNLTLWSLSSLMDASDKEMYNNFKGYVKQGRKDTSEYMKGMMCDGKDAVFTNDFSMSYQYMCYNENAQPDCNFKGLYTDWIYKVGKNKKTKKKDVFMCNQPCGCWIGNPKVKKANFGMKTVKDDWSTIQDQLNKWKVPKDMKADYKSGSMFDNAKFQNFNYFFRSGNSASFEMSVGSIRNKGNGEVQIGYLDTQSYTWLANRWETERVPYNELEYQCFQNFNSATQQWEQQCQQVPVYKGEIRQPKKKGPEALKTGQINAISKALKHVAFKQLEEKIDATKV